MTGKPVALGFHTELEFKKVGFVFEERENWSTWRKTSRSKERINNKRNPHMMPGPGIEPRPHWWEAIKRSHN